MENYPQELAQDAVCQSHTGHMIGLFFLPTRPLRLNTNERMLSGTVTAAHELLDLVLTFRKHRLLRCKEILRKSVLNFTRGVWDMKLYFKAPENKRKGKLGILLLYSFY